MSFDFLKTFLDEHLEKYKVIQKIIDIILLPSLLCMFIRIAFTLGYLKMLPFQQILGINDSIVNVLISPVKILKTIVAPFAKELIYFKSGAYIEPLVIVSIVVFLILGFINAFIGRKVNNKLDWRRRQSILNNQRSRMKMKEWQDKRQ